MCGHVYIFVVVTHSLGGIAAQQYMKPRLIVQSAFAMVLTQVATFRKGQYVRGENFTITRAEEIGIHQQLTAAGKAPQGCLLCDVIGSDLFSVGECYDCVTCIASVCGTDWTICRCCHAPCEPP